MLALESDRADVHWKELSHTGKSGILTEWGA